MTMEQTLEIIDLYGELETLEELICLAEELDAVLTADPEPDECGCVMFMMLASGVLLTGEYDVETERIIYTAETLIDAEM